MLPLYMFSIFNNISASLPLLLLSFIAGLRFGTLPAFIFKIFDIHLYKIKDKSKVLIIKNNIKSSSINTEDNKPLGYFYGYWYVGYLSEPTNRRDEEGECYIITTSKIFNKVTKHNSEKIKEESGIKEETIQLWSRKGGYYNINYIKRELKVTKFNPRENQNNIITKIIDSYKKSDFNINVSYIYGEPNSGKSMIGILLAKKLNASIVRSFNPTEPNDNIDNLYSEVNPCEEKPLIIVLDEFDIILKKIHVGVESHKYMPIQVKDKSDWNIFLDDISIGLYPHIILLLTSNLKPDTINETYDKSYIREGRVNNFFNL